MFVFRRSILKEDRSVDVQLHRTISPARQKLGTRRHCALYYRTVLRVTIHVRIVVVTGKMKTSSIPTAITLYCVDIHHNKRMQSGA